jgi:hypothetical protein
MYKYTVEKTAMCFCNFQKAEQSKQSPNRRKFTQYGHPDHEEHFYRKNSKRQIMYSLAWRSGHHMRLWNKRY